MLVNYQQNDLIRFVQGDEINKSFDLPLLKFKFSAIIQS